MNNTQNIENLKNLVAKKIEAGGFLNSLRAQLKVEVYKIIESQDQRLKENVGFQWEHPLLNQIKGMTEGIKSLELILEYLEFFKFDYTAQVLRKEANFNDPIIKESLARKLGLNSSLDSMRPLLMILVSEFSKGGSTINIQSPVNNAAPPETNITRNQQNKKQQEEEQKRKQEEEQKKKDQEEKKKLEEKQKKEQADSKKATKKEGKDRPQTAPPKPEQPAPNVNKIRGGQTKQNALTSMFGLDLGGNQNQFEEDDIFSNKPKQQQQQQQKPQQNTKVNNQIKNNNAYAYDVGADSQSKNQKAQNVKGNAGKQVSSDPYAFDLDEQPKQSQKKYDYDPNQTIGKKFNNPYAIGDPQKGQPQKGQKNDEIEEDIDDFQQSRDDRAKQSNQLFTSDDDYQRATQSLGVDESVDSLALEEYDYYEDVFRKR
ncbi:unnamed protein product (macronuclear) [Paramecium tetraurelia]|uniref:FGFR1 oncogene partner (FOP) N-terminal dimerisation domain-containing protein n=1 Tax=Paramecium tetraurelia TaxID=5888 RepID=A0DBD0_PARTE|nr:uncharacterized protein GSPATT00015241001 [Paramecium tetraurelia]CAK80347.1 unnamed protein product [Paramecium tetraurelia]|eukprot:XP_001447744.1 hypothetical protein (macronuclear) [Paramecium tetraurelia strain d4-2]